MSRLPSEIETKFGGPCERDIHLKMIDTLCNTISSGANAFAGLPPDKIEELVREIAERELKEKP